MTRLTTKHQTTIPADLRRALGLKAGDRVQSSVEGSTVKLRNPEPRLSDDLVFRVSRRTRRAISDTPEDDEAFP